MHTVGLTTAYYHCMLHLDNILLPGIYISLPPLTSRDPPRPLIIPPLMPPRGPPRVPNNST